MNDLLGRSNRGRVVEAPPDVEMGRYPPSDQLTSMKADAGSMADFYKEIEVVQVEINKIKKLLLKLQDENEEGKELQRADTLKVLREQMDADIASVTKAAQFIKVKLEELDQSNLLSRKVRGCEAGTAVDRQRLNVTNNQRKKLKEVMNEFQALRAKMVYEYKETIERRYYTVTGQQADEETIEDMIRTGESETFLRKAIREQGRGQVIETIREIQERYDGVKEIERNLLELHQIFMDISVLVDAQGQLINDIQANVERATSYTREGAVQLAIARRHQLSKRKWSCVCILLLIIIIAVLLIVLKILKVI